MRALRVVGLTEDGEVVLEDPVRLERYTVPADERLRAAARGDLSRLGQIAIELESQLRPREIQARIRAGASVEQVATAAGVPEQKIERFAYPVLLERLRTADNAQRAHPMRADGPDNRTLGEVVAHTFGLRGQAYEGVKWDSWKGEDGRWVVALSWRAGRSDNRAHWVFQPGAHGGTVTALDEHASDLVEGLPARPLRTVGAVVDMTRPEEEPPPAPSPVEQWRAAASDSFREQRLPTAPDAGRRTPSEPWRPTPPQRQAEPPADPRPGRQDPDRQAEPLADPRPAAYRPTEPLADPRPAGRPEAYRPTEPLADPRPARPDPPSYQRTERPAGYRRPTRPRPRGRSPTPERGGGGGRTTAEWAPWERGVTRTAAPPAPPCLQPPCPVATWRCPRPGPRRRPDPDAGRAGNGRDAPLASPVIPAPTAEKDPVVEPATEPAAAVDVRQAETPAVTADAPTTAKPEEAVAAPDNAARRPGDRPPSRSRDGSRRAGRGRTIWIRTIRSRSTSRTIWSRTIRRRTSDRTAAAEARTPPAPTEAAPSRPADPAETKAPPPALRQAHPQGQAGHAVVGRGAPGGPRATLNGLIDDSGT